MEAESQRPLADPPATWQEHWFDHRQLLRLYHSDEHCAIYVDPGVRRAEVRWCAVTGVSDVIDVSVALCARDRGHPVITSDPGDIHAVEPSLRLLSPT